MKQILKRVWAGLILCGAFGIPTAMADTATFGNANAWYGTDTFTAVDIPTGLEADADAAQDARGVWNVWTNPVDHLTVANNTDPANPGGVTFSGSVHFCVETEWSSQAWVVAKGGAGRWVNLPVVR